MQIALYEKSKDSHHRRVSQSSRGVSHLEIVDLDDLITTQSKVKMQAATERQTRQTPRPQVPPI